MQDLGSSYVGPPKYLT
jgi:hypothetical protein